jgi:hypothetical protein
MNSSQRKNKGDPKRGTLAHINMAILIKFCILLQYGEEKELLRHPVIAFPN